jgi:hypothetical protein
LNIALPAALRRLATDIEDGAVPPATQDRLRAALAPALACAARDAAVRRLAELLGRYRESRWQTALRVERKLREHSRVAYGRIRTGARGPYDETEELCQLVLDCGGLKARRIWTALSEAMQETGGSNRSAIATKDPSHV